MNRPDGLKGKRKAGLGESHPGLCVQPRGWVGRLSAWLVWGLALPDAVPLKEPAPSGRGLQVFCHWVSDCSWEEGRSICDPSNLSLQRKEVAHRKQRGETGGEGAGHSLYKNTSKDTTQAD